MPPTVANSSIRRSPFIHYSPFTLHYSLFLFLLALLFLAPRLPELNRFVTDDERKWLVRSGNFYQAISAGEWANTFQREHPGVMVMWAGTAGFLWRDPAYAREVPGQLGWTELEVEPFLRARGHEPMELLAAGRGVLVGLITLVLLAAAWVAARLMGWAAAFAGLAFVALDPFHIALSRLLHLDGLVSSLMLLAVLLALLYLEERKRRWLLLAGAVTGLAVLTKSPALFLLPFVGLLMLVDTLTRPATASVRERGMALVGRYLPWLGAALLVFVLLWPAVWVEPLATPIHMFDESTDYAEGRHLSTIFFNGAAFEGDPGPTFYPTAFLWRTTPVVLAGLLLVALALLRRIAPLNDERVRRTVGTLLLFVALYGLLITLGSKKLDRYALPLFAPLDIVAGVGWLAAAEWLGGRGGRWRAGLVAGVLGGVLALQAWGTLATAPYFLTYYNPLLGGTARAPQVMMVGRGEGAEEAARLLTERGVATERVWVWSPEILAYHLPGKLPLVEMEADVDNLREWLALDYAVLYVGDWQRRLLPDDLLDYFAQQQPEATVWLDGLEYARLYDLHDTLPPDALAVGTPHFTEWGGAIRLVAYELPEQPLAPDESAGVATFHLQNRAPIAQDLNVLVRLVTPDGQEVWRDEGWPFGSPTSTWQPGEIWPDGHELTLPADLAPGTYRLELSFYDPVTFDALSAINPRTGAALGSVLVVDEVTIGN